MVEISEMDASSNRTWSETEVVCCMRDIDVAFQRVLTRPDMCIILCAEFQKKHFELGGSIILLPDVPSGWVGGGWWVGERGPAYFPSVGNGITLSHRNSPLANKMRGGHRDFASLLLAGDSIFIEDRIGRRPEVCVA